MAGRVPLPLMHERSERLRSLIEAGSRSFMRGQIGLVKRIIVENGDYRPGITSNYLKVEAPGICALPNSWLDVIIDGTAGGRSCTAHPSMARGHEPGC